MANDLQILFEDDDLIAVNKPAGLLAEASHGDVDSMLARVSSYLGRTAIAYHRLDRGTTGCMLLGKTPRFNKQMARIFAEKKIRKEYWAIVQGQWPKSLNRIDAPLAPLGGGEWQVDLEAGKASSTTFRILGMNDDFAWVAALPKTGRTHQIRLHCRHAGCAIVGDSLYGKENDGGLMLHARSVRLKHPGSGEPLNILAKVHQHWNNWESHFPKIEE